MMPTEEKPENLEKLPLQPKGKKIHWKIAVPVIALIASLVVLGGYLVITLKSNVASNTEKSDKSAAAGPVKTAAPLKAATAQSIAVTQLCGGGARPVPQKLLQTSGNKSGTTAGYGKCPALSRAWRFIPSAEAAGPTFTPVVFYAKPVDGVDQIFVYSLTTQSETQLTNESERGAAKPVYSSQSQQISYVHKTSIDATNVLTQSGLVIADMATGESTRLAPIGNERYQPLAWSPDGRKLLYTLTDDSVPPPDGPRSKLFVYDLASKASTQLYPPNGLNDIEGYDGVVWRDDSTVDVKFTNHSMGAYVNTQEYLVDVNTLAATPIPSISTGSLAGIQSFGDYLYSAKSYTDARLQRAPISNPAQAELIPGATDVGSFQLRLNKAGDSLAEIIVITGGGGNPDVKIKSLPPAGGTPQVLHEGSGFSAALLGWGLDYSSLLWLSFDSGKSSLHLLNLDNNADTLLVDGLGFIQ